MATMTPIPDNISEIAGPLLIASVVNWALFGVLSLQVYLYFEGYPNDRIWIKVMVYFVFALEIVQSILFMDSAFNALARGFGNLSALDHIGTIWLSVPLIDGLVAWIVQSYYGYRIYVLSRSKTLTGIVLMLSLVQFVAAVVTASAGSRAGTFSNLLSKDTLIKNAIWEGGSALCDIVIAITMTYVLRKRDSGAVKTTHDLITRIIRLTIETGALTAVVAIVALILTFVPPDATYYIVGVVVLGKLYSTTLMVILNIRPRGHDAACACSRKAASSYQTWEGPTVSTQRRSQLPPQTFDSASTKHGPAELMSSAGNNMSGRVEVQVMNHSQVTSDLPSTLSCSSLTRRTLSNNRDSEYGTAPESAVEPCTV